MFEVTVNTRRAVVGSKELITTSSAGIQVQFTFSEDWDGLSRFAIFRNGDEGQEVAVALPNSNLTVIPAQSCSEEYVDEPVFVGVYGTDGLGAVAIPTIWTSLGVLRPGAVTTDIITPAEPTPDMWAQILAIANEAAAIADECEENEETRIVAEQQRTGAETARANAETLRAQAETERSRNETQRQSAETQRQTAEDARAQAEALRAQAEELRQANETNRVSAENTRASNERSRQSHELERDSAESLRGIREMKRIEAEWDRQSAETARASAETSRASAESSRATAEQNRASAETARASAESARASAESTRASNEQGRVSAETDRVQAETDRATEFATWESTIASKVPNTRTVNGKALSTDITLDSGDIGFDATETYQSGTAGAALNDLTQQLSGVEDAVNDETTGLDTKAPVILETASGAIASFNDGADSMPIRKIVATIEPVQSGSGDPSPDNVRPISGWTQANIFATEKNMMECTSDNMIGTGVTVDNGILTTSFHTVTEAGIVFPVKPNTRYIVGFTKLSGGPMYVRCAEYSKKPTSYGSDRIREIIHSGDIVESDAKNTITTGPNAQYVFYGFYRSYKSNAQSVDKWFANLESAGNAYEPYTGETLPINWQDTAGTVYCGTITLNEDGSADLVVNTTSSVLPTSAGSDWYRQNINGTYYFVHSQSNFKNYKGLLACSHFIVAGNTSAIGNNPDNSICNAFDRYYPLNIRCDSITTVEDFVSFLTDNQVQYVYKTAPRTYHFDNVGQLKSFLGVNNIWCDTGDITELTYPADTKLFLTARDEEITGNIAPIENGTTARKAYAQGTYFWHDTKFCKALTAIASGATFTLGTNYQETTVAAELLAAQN